MTRVTASATATAHQIPLMPNTIGSINTAASCITSVLRKDMVADTSPLPRPEKKPEPNTLNPQNRNDMEKSIIPVCERYSLSDFLIMVFVMVSEAVT